MEQENIEKEVGRVFTYFSKIGVAGIKLSGVLKKGDKIRVKGATTDFEQIVGSMQIENRSVDKAKSKDSVGIKVSDRVRPNDIIYLIK